MATGNKVCPKCSKEMGLIQNVLVIPVASSSSYGDRVSTTDGLTVAALVCPDCRFVELYHHKT